MFRKVCEDGVMGVNVSHLFFVGSKTKLVGGGLPSDSIIPSPFSWLLFFFLLSESVLVIFVSLAGSAQSLGGRCLVRTYLVQNWGSVRCLHLSCEVYPRNRELQIREGLANKTGQDWTSLFTGGPGWPTKQLGTTIFHPDTTGVLLSLRFFVICCPFHGGSSRCQSVVTHGAVTLRRTRSFVNLEPKWMTSIFVGFSPPKTRPKFKPKQGSSKGSRNVNTDLRDDLEKLIKTHRNQSSYMVVFMGI